MDCPSLFSGITKYATFKNIRPQCISLLGLKYVEQVHSKSVKN